MGQPAPVRVSVRFWNNCLVQGLTDNFCTGAAKNAFRLRVPAGDDAACVSIDDRIQRRIYGQAESVLAFLNGLGLSPRGGSCLGKLRGKPEKLTPGG